MKRMLAVLLTAVMMLAGCSAGTPLTPDEYAELHKELFSGVGHERTWLKY